MRRELEKLELERLRRLKDSAVYEMIGKCELINDRMKAVENGSWYRDLEEYKKLMEKENEKC